MLISILSRTVRYRAESGFMYTIHSIAQCGIPNESTFVFDRNFREDEVDPTERSDPIFIAGNGSQPFQMFYRDLKTKYISLIPAGQSITESCVIIDYSLVRASRKDLIFEWFKSV